VDEGIISPHLDVAEELSVSRLLERGWLRMVKITKEATEHEYPPPGVSTALIKADGT
jgi:hypothetical protein